MDNNKLYEKVINECDAYEPYRPMTAEEQMDMKEVVEQLHYLRCIYFGTRIGMALGLAIKKIKNET